MGQKLLWDKIVTDVEMKTKPVIIVHPGKAHLDDFLSACLVLSKEKAIAIHRKEPIRDEILDSRYWKLDIGGGHDPTINLFDHHHKVMEDCTISLLLKHWGLWDISLECFDWLDFLVFWDTNPRSPKTKEIPSFVENVILWLFENKNCIIKYDFEFWIMQMIGKRFFDKIEEYKIIKQKVQATSKLYPIQHLGVINCLGIDFNDTLLRVLENIKQPWTGGKFLITDSNRKDNTIEVRYFGKMFEEEVERIKNAKIDGITFIHPAGILITVDNQFKDKLNEILDKIVTIFTVGHWGNKKWECPKCLHLSYRSEWKSNDPEGLFNSCSYQCPKCGTLTNEYDLSDQYDLRKAENSEKILKK
jgi:hypothetical protein